MGLFKSVISDARPAKSSGTTVQAKAASVVQSAGSQHGRMENRNGRPSTAASFLRDSPEGGSPQGPEALALPNTARSQVGQGSQQTPNSGEASVTGSRQKLAGTPAANPDGGRRSVGGIEQLEQSGRIEQYPVKRAQEAGRVPIDPPDHVSTEYGPSNARRDRGNTCQSGSLGSQGIEKHSDKLEVSHGVTADTSSTGDGSVTVSGITGDHPLAALAAAWSAEPPNRDSSLAGQGINTLSGDGARTPHNVSNRNSVSENETPHRSPAISIPEPQVARDSAGNMSDEKFEARGPRRAEQSAADERADPPTGMELGEMLASARQHVGEIIDNAVEPMVEDTSALQELLNETASQATSAEPLGVLPQTRSVDEDWTGQMEILPVNQPGDDFYVHPQLDPAERPPSGGDLQDVPQLSIGQVDVFVEKSAPAASRTRSADRPTPSLASRHYLRRL